MRMDNLNQQFRKNLNVVNKLVWLGVINAIVGF